jgi:hypothetical protein
VACRSCASPAALASGQGPPGLAAHRGVGVGVGVLGWGWVRVRLRAALTRKYQLGPGMPGGLRTSCAVTRQLLVHLSGPGS